MPHCRIEGWLKIYETELPQTPRPAYNDGETYAEDFAGIIKWLPGFCVIRQDEQSLVCYKSEQAARQQQRTNSIKVVRLDGGYKSFYRQWGYLTPPPLPETQSFLNAVVLENGVLYCGAAVGLGGLVEENTSYDYLESSGTESLDRRQLAGRFLPPSSPMSSHSVAMVESPSTPHKLANFFARPFRSGLKRTKSVSKLGDKKRFNVDLSSAPDHRQLLNRLHFRNDNIRSSRSHESLLSYSTTTHMIDLSGSAAVVKPLHSSVLSADHVFEVTTRGGATKYYACRSAAERERWIQSIKSTMHPNRDKQRRTENNLQLWILEAKGISAKRKYFCEICFDKVLYGRTSSKLKSEICFWGENFDFKELPKIEVICVNLYRDASEKKKKDRSTLIGYVNIPVSVLVERQPVERWYTVIGCGDKSTVKGETPAIRIKGRFQTVNILPLKCYSDFIQYLQAECLPLCLTMETALSVKAKEDLATHLVHILQKLKSAKDFLCDLVMAEIKGLDNEHLMFRGNSLATKAMEGYMKLVGEQYLQDTLGDVIRTVMESNDDCEVDPVKVGNAAQLEKNRRNLMEAVQVTWGKVINSFHYFPIELREVFCGIRQRLMQVGRGDLSDNLISSSIFLRFLCPAILSPSLFNLVSEYPNEKTARNLTLIAKALQSLANFTKFGGKELYMEFMNDFVEREWDDMKEFLFKISSPINKDSRSLEFDGYVDLGKELSLLHNYLVESFSNLVKLKQCNLTNLSELQRILDNITEMLNNSNGNSIANGSSFASGGGSLSPVTPISDYDNNDLTSPFGSANGNGNDSASDYRSFSTNNTLTSRAKVLNLLQNSASGHSTLKSSSSSGSDTGAKRFGLRSSNPSAAASHLNSVDDYVMFTAIDENLGLRKTGLAVQQNRQNLRMNLAAGRNASPLSPPLNSSVAPMNSSQTTPEVPRVNNNDTTDDHRHRRGSIGNGLADSLYYVDDSMASASSCDEGAVGAGRVFDNLKNSTGRHRLSRSIDMMLSTAEMCETLDDTTTSLNYSGRNASTSRIYPQPKENVSATTSVSTVGKNHLTPTSSSETPSMKNAGSQTSMGALSSGYQSLSFSNSSSPIENPNDFPGHTKSAMISPRSNVPSKMSHPAQLARQSRFEQSSLSGPTGDFNSPVACSSPNGRQENIVAPAPLSFSNPLYQLQQIPLLKKSTSASLPDIQATAAGLTPATSPLATPTVSIPQSPRTLSPVPLPRVKAASVHSRTDYSRIPPDFHSITNRLNITASSDSRSHRIEINPLSPNHSAVVGRKFQQSTKPRTNPRLMASTTVGADYTPPMIRASPRMGTGMRRARTDGSIVGHLRSPGGTLDSTDVSEEFSIAESPAAPVKDKYAEELEEMRRQLELTQEKLKEAEERERLWRQKYESQVQPVNKLQLLVIDEEKRLSRVESDFNATQSGKLPLGQKYSSDADGGAEDYSADDENCSNAGSDDVTSGTGSVYGGTEESSRTVTNLMSPLNVSNDSGGSFDHAGVQQSSAEPSPPVDSRKQSGTVEELHFATLHDDTTTM